MRDFNKKVDDAFSQMRLRVAETAFNHITTAIGLFDSGAHSQACFLAITAIEEMGKARTLQLVQTIANHNEQAIQIDAKGIERFLREHSLKATRAAASGLSVNHSALRRHGRHEEADLNMTSGILFLTKSNQWMELRNSCIYSDIDLHSKVIDWPAKHIQGDHGYYFICMALEVLARESEAGFGSIVEHLDIQGDLTDFQNATEFRTRMEELVLKFMLQYQDSFEKSNLEFFTEHPQYDDVRETVRNNEVRVDMDHREQMEEFTDELLSEIENPSPEREHKLPDGISYEDYQSVLKQEMIDIAMDAPYYKDPGTHPELKSLREHVSGYIEFV